MIVSGVGVGVDEGEVVGITVGTGEGDGAGVGEGIRVGTDEEVGLEVGVGRFCASQFAVAILGLAMTMGFEGEELPEASPAQPEKTY